MGRAAVRIHTMKSSLMKPLFSGSNGSNSYTGFIQFTGLAVPERQSQYLIVNSSLVNTSVKKHIAKWFLKRTFETFSEVIFFVSRIPELHMLICVPSNAFLYQINFCHVAVGVVVIQLQGV